MEKEAKNLIYRALKLRPYDLELLTSAFEISSNSLFYISITGLVILPLSFILLSRAARMTPASNVSIIMLLETILGPLWVWIFISESPQLLTIIGGIIVILALVYFFSNKRA